MKDEQATTLIWVLAAVVAIGALVVAFLVVRQQNGDSGQPSDEAEIFEEIFGSQFPEGAFDEGFVDRRLEEIGEPLGGKPFESIAAAERQTGYDIPEPSADFVLRDGLTYLESFWRPATETAPLSRSRYDAPDGAAITFELVPSTYDVTESRSQGVPTVFGGKDGWMLDTGDSDYFFAWVCGDTSSGSEIYCTVSADGSVDEGTFEYFVETLR